MIWIIFFLFGLIVGSFLNVVVYRLETVESLWGRSHCPHCKAKVRWYDNIPLLSFLLLQARCRDCEQKISWQYPLLELATGLVFAVVGSLFFSPETMSTWIETAFWITIFSLLLVIFVYDFRFMEITMLVLWGAVGVSLVHAVYLDWSTFQAGKQFLDFRTFSGLAGGASAFLFFFCLAYFSKERWMGMGDAYVGLLVGLITGWPLIFLVLTVAFSIGAVFGLILIATGKKTMQSQVPFAPFLVLSVFCVTIMLKAYPHILVYLWPLVR